ncbi:MAG: phosphopantothenoylcysteine decarboxylase / phosphopantothenate---cysteine ligase [Methanothermococcus sp.]|jgi:phosphopantothenoylcysteine decarboxylase/phosphopantothenate--cysteine ligase|uniref:bifunctional phosphopantothenoylcysteine decarboxylase/phosphopantothenate--cysteine ligase CoaBC n=1 Tax=Methanothermococcus TaxID=155862 RepID=UPI00037D4C51|nr:MULTISPECIES: bifunctional phosphopantothenoylcysteine decarboxylase/phosphopantothenate--cysteine ligase CoaBC [Methanothermococcus]MDK2790480.1 phosphopantothenoylcysteine decarboxylase / phosphopantothenate---cysteine ligase [Methanothermococcus sp.]MDK2987620.1 phosphopantothenoylcysteine decarboxylase / phosphopantothenate---cysteine ligase [Methanothermococcus sp.]
MHPTKRIKNSKSKLLDGKKIVVGVTSSIAAIEAPKLMRELIRHGAEVYCIMTEETEKIVGKYALTFGCGNEVMDEITGNIEHVYLYDTCDAMVIYPATANIISKISLNIADNIVNTTAMMFFEKKPLFIVPAMHQNMLDTIEERHISNLAQKKNIYIIAPKMEEEKAKVSSIEDVTKHIIKVLNKNRSSEKKVLILTGGTAEFIDKVRVISNLSSGKTGVSLAESFCKEGLEVEVINGLGMEPSYYINSHKVTTTEEMLNKALELGKNADVIISCAAISDYKPENTFEGKISSDEELVIKLKKNPKVLAELRKKFPDKIIIGFKAEYGLKKEELIEKAKERLEEYNLNMIIANDLSKYYFGDDYNEVILITKSQMVEIKGKKRKIAEEIVKFVNENLLK